MNRDFCVPDLGRYSVRDLDGIETPRLLFYEWALRANLEGLKALCGGFENLRLMAKTCKASALLERYREAGLEAVKASCVSEAEVIAAHTGIADILVAFPCFGPSADAFIALRGAFPEKRFSVVVANLACARGLSRRADAEVHVYLDIDPGMKRTGVPFGRAAVELADAVASLPHLTLHGLQVYDGNVHQRNPHAARRYSEALMQKIDDTVAALSPKHTVHEVVTSSSLTMQGNLEAHRAGSYRWRHTVSPGTAVLWDSSYNDIMPGAFAYAAAVATRILDSHPHRAGHLLTTDCGLKLGVSAEFGPVHVLGFRGYAAFGKSERFGMLKWLGFDRATGEPVANDLLSMVGRVVLVFPRHVCTTVNQYAFGLLVRDGAVAETVQIDARDG